MKEESLILYIEHKDGHDDKGPAYIGRVKYSKSGNTIYFNGKAFKSSKGQGAGANFYDVETGDSYWISGIKKNGTNRHWAGAGKIQIEKAAVTEYLNLRGLTEIPKSEFQIVENFSDTDISKFASIENSKIVP